MSSDPQTFRGTAVSPGVAHGPAYVLACTKRTAAAQRTIDADQVTGELARFEAALSRAEKEILALKADVTERIGDREAEIFAAHAMVLRDPVFHTKVVDAIRNKLINAESAVSEVVDKFVHAFDQIPDAYLRERAVDIRDVGRRLLGALIDGQGPEMVDVPEGSILVTDELLPSVTARLELARVGAFVTERGGKFSHSAILARSQRTPAVTNLPEVSHAIRTGDHLIVDGMSGVVFVNPDRSVQREYQRVETELRNYNEGLKHLVDLPSLTQDGASISLLANVSKFSDAESAFLYRADGIGLYRTEFAFSVRSEFPTEDEQFELLKRAAERFHPRKVVFRVLDIGGDKELSYFPLPARRNPSLADRGIRLLLKNPEVLKRQLRAFLRISAEHPVSILLPVVGGLEEVRQARAVLRQAQQELAAAGMPFNPRVPVGAMIEVPSAALIAPALAREVDFFSLGTNDLVQYVLAADREDESVAAYYQPLHPAVLSLIHFVAEAARKAGIGLTICGEMAGNPAYTELLVGLGLRELSVAPGEMLEVKNAIRRITIAGAEALAAQALRLGTAGDVETLISAARGVTIDERAPDAGVELVLSAGSS
jgi:phosphotransferase system enzyme I (PtsI)